MITCLLHPIRERFTLKTVMALDVLLWLFCLPVLLRICPISVLFGRLARSKNRSLRTSMNQDDIIGIVTRVCNLRLFDSSPFPKRCLRQSLALYRVLSRMGHPVQIHFGVNKDESGFRGHSWMTMAGEPFADTTQTGLFKAVYSYPPAGQFQSVDRTAKPRLQNRSAT